MGGGDLSSSPLAPQTPLPPAASAGGGGHALGGGDTHSRPQTCASLPAAQVISPSLGLTLEGWGLERGERVERLAPGDQEPVEVSQESDASASGGGGGGHALGGGAEEDCRVGGEQGRQGVSRSGGKRSGGGAVGVMEQKEGEEVFMGEGGGEGRGGLSRSGGERSGSSSHVLGGGGRGFKVEAGRRRVELVEDEGEEVSGLVGVGGGVSRSDEEEVDEEETAVDVSAGVGWEENVHAALARGIIYIYIYI